MKYKIAWPIILSVLLIVLISIFSYLNLKKHITKKINPDNLLKNLGIIQKPIEFNSERKVLTAIYRKQYVGDCDYEKLGVDKCIKITPKLIVLHMSANDSLDKSFKKLYSSFYNPRQNSIMNNSHGDNLNNSVHFLIDKDGIIYNLMPETLMAKHAEGVNHLSIAIEAIGFFPTKKQIESSSLLIEYLIKKYPTIKGVIAHKELEFARLVREKLGIK